MGELQIYGIRHHGPGSARSVQQALWDYQPDCLLVEGPPEGEVLLPLITSPHMQPPVALLLYAQPDPTLSVFYPFAQFSPEWQALQYGLNQGICVRFFDLPVAWRWGTSKPLPTTEDSAPSPNPALQQDPLLWLAQAAGFADGERWWEQMVEERRQTQGVFQGVLEAMSALREASPIPALFEQQREAYMRQQIRLAQTQGFARIAVVCGAWHAPALTASTPEADQALLQGLNGPAVEATWIPWSHSRLSRNSGYGAGVHAPGWYLHLWQTPQQVSERWLAKVAALLRQQDLEASSAQVIEAVRLADALAALRERPLAGLEELNEAAIALFGHGQTKALELIARQLLLSEQLGQVPPETPSTPLQQDLWQQQKRLRLPPAQSQRTLELDLRKSTDLERSQLLHRLGILGIDWGQPIPTYSRGTFKEGWNLSWQPEFALLLIDASKYGPTVAQAATERVLEGLPEATISQIGPWLERALLAKLPQASTALLQQLQNQAAQGADLLQLMQTLPALGRIARYGNVRQSDHQTIEAVFGNLLSRVCIGLPTACSGLANEPAEQMLGLLLPLHDTVITLQNPEWQEEWFGTLQVLSKQIDLHGLLAGRCVKLLHEGGYLNSQQTALRLSQALSNPNPQQAGAWIDGFLRGSGLALVHDHGLWALLDQWLLALSPEAFTKVLPLLRRTFSTFASPERQALGQKAKGGFGPTPTAPTHFNPQRGQQVLPLLSQLLGLSEEP